MATFDWTRDEILVVLDAVDRTGWAGLRASSDEAIGLSRLLNAARIHPQAGCRLSTASTGPPSLRGTEHAKALAYLELLREPGAIYDGAPDPARRDLLGALFERVLVYVEDEGLDVTPERSKANTMAHEIVAATIVPDAFALETTKAPRSEAGGERLGDPHSSPLVRGLSKARLAGMVDVCSNLSDGGLTSVALRALAHTQLKRPATHAPQRPRAHKLEQRLGADKVVELARRYGAGEGATALANEHGVAASALLRMLRSHDVLIRARLVTDDLTQQFAAEYTAGATVTELAAAHGWSRGAVLRALHSSSVPMRSKSPRPKGV